MQRPPLLTYEARCRYYVTSSGNATLTISSGVGTSFLTVIHESHADSAQTCEIVDVGVTEPIKVSDGETVILIERAKGHVRATLICEVDCESAEFGYILSPRGGYNLLLHQAQVARPVAVIPPGTEIIEVIG